MAARDRLDGVVAWIRHPILPTWVTITSRRSVKLCKRTWVSSPATVRTTWCVGSTGPGSSCVVILGALIVGERVVMKQGEARPRLDSGSDPFFGPKNDAQRQSADPKCAPHFRFPCEEITE